MKDKTNLKRNEKFFLRPCLIVLSGVPLTGKTVLAEKLINLSNLEVVDIDVIRNEVDESRKKDGRVRMLKPEEEKAVMIKSYGQMCQQAQRIMANGMSVIMTGTFSRDEFKQSLKHLIKILKKKDIPFKIFLLTAPDEEISKRIKKRNECGSFSNIDSLEKYHWAKGIFEKIEFAPTIEIDTSKPNHVERIIRVLEDLKILTK